MELLCAKTCKLGEDCPLAKMSEKAIFSIYAIVGIDVKFSCAGHTKKVRVVRFAGEAKIHPKGVTWDKSKLVTHKHRPYTNWSIKHPSKCSRCKIRLSCKRRQFMLHSIYLVYIMWLGFGGTVSFSCDGNDLPKTYVVEQGSQIRDGSKLGSFGLGGEL